jgi:hypothetical protein
MSWTISLQSSGWIVWRNEAKVSRFNEHGGLVSTTLAPAFAYGKPLKGKPARRTGPARRPVRKANFAKATPKIK